MAPSLPLPDGADLDQPDPRLYWPARARHAAILLDNLARVGTRTAVGSTQILELLAKSEGAGSAYWGKHSPRKGLTPNRVAPAPDQAEPEEADA